MVRVISPKNIRLLLIVLMVALPLLYWKQKERALLQNNPTTQSLYLHCDDISDKSQRFSCYKDVALSATSRGETTQQLLSYTSSLKSPHLAEHSIGIALLVTADHNLEIARSKCEPDCRDAYYHAWAEEWAAYAPNRLTDFESFLTKYCPLDEEDSAPCYHNLGHFYEGVTKNIDQSFALCDKYKSESMFAMCLDGAIHEYFIQSGTDGFFAMCAKYGGRTKSVCYSRGTELYPGWMSDTIDYQNPLKICEDISPLVPASYNQCYKSLVWNLQHHNNVIVPLTACDQIDQKYKRLCIHGVQNPEGSVATTGCTIGSDNSNACTTASQDDHP